MIVINDMKVKGRVIPRRQLIAIWQSLSYEPFPRVRAFQIDDVDFERLLKRQQCGDDEIREIEEWGRVLSVKETDACVFIPNLVRNVDYVIIVRKTPYNDLAEILEHELTHIARGDL